MGTESKGASVALFSDDVRTNKESELTRVRLKKRDIEPTGDSFEILFRNASNNYEESGLLRDAALHIEEIGHIAEQRGLTFRGYNHRLGTGIPELHPHPTKKI